MKVRDTSPAVDAMSQNWALIDALIGGTNTMRAAGKRYLPKWSGEDDQDYKTRLSVATLFPAYERTVSVLTGKPFSKPITIGEDVPSRFVPWFEDIDLQGRNIHSFASDICAEALAYGFCGILVDYPTNTGLKTVADEQQAGVRPYFVQVGHGNLLGWRSRLVNGSIQLTQLRLLEIVEEDDGAFGTKMIEQVRVLEPGLWSTYRKTKDASGKDDWAIYDEGTTTLPYIPFVPIYGRRKDFMIGTPPMLELAHANVEHWQSKSDQQTILHVARVPILFGKLLGDSGLKIGSGYMASSNDEHADLKYVEHSGKAIESGRVSILDIEDRMRQIGAELLVIKPGNITEAQTLADNEQGMCDLQRIMQHMESGLDQALQYMADWVGEQTGGHITIYKDFGATTLAEASAELLFKMQSVGSLSLETLLSELKRRGALSPDIDVEDEIERAHAEHEQHE